MIKRFIDSDLFSKKFFRSLSAEEKVLWFYITQSCTYDGFWEHDEDAVSFYCNNFTGPIPPIIIEKLGMYQVDNEQWFLSKWILFQYGPLRLSVRPHTRIIERLHRKGLDTVFPELLKIPYLEDN
jgi:hypothetical protein